MKKKVKKLSELEDKIDTIKEEKAPFLTFDEYFQLLRNKNPKVLAHHKAPIRTFMERLGLKRDATEQEFDELLRNY